MLQIHVSRRLNSLLGGKKGQMLCSRVYISHWVQLERLLDAIFGKLHCKECYLWEANNETEILPATTLEMEDQKMSQSLRCINCLEMIENPEDVLIVTKHTDRGDKDFHFCSHHCEQDFYINYLRQLEGDTKCLS